MLFGSKHNDVATFDLPAKRLAKIFSRCDAHYPISDAFEADKPSKAAWYKDQQEHLVGFLREYDGPGAYNRKSRDLTSRHFWNHFQCARGLLWAAEALGVDEKLVRRAAEDATGIKHTAAQCAAVRRVISWEKIAERLIEIQ